MNPDRFLGKSPFDFVGTDTMNDPICSRVRDLVAEDLSRNNETIACLMGYHHYYLSSAFKRSEGMTLHQFILQQRLSRAHELIVTTYLPIGEIAAACGFSSANYFGLIFKKKEGISPLTYRKNQLAKF